MIESFYQLLKILENKLNILVLNNYAKDYKLVTNLNNKNNCIFLQKFSGNLFLLFHIALYLLLNLKRFLI